MKAPAIALAVAAAMPGAGLQWRQAVPLPLPRAGYAAGVIDGTAWVAGGSYWHDGLKQRTNKVEGYNVKCDCWQVAAPMPTARSSAAYVTVAGRLYVMGGSVDGHASRDVVSFDGRTWRKEDAMALPEPRVNGMAVAVGHRIVLLGGLEREDERRSGLRAVWNWDLKNPGGKWTAMPECPCGARASAATAVHEERVILAGGLRADTDAIENLSDVWELDDQKKHWQRVGDLPEGRRAASLIVDGNRVYLLGGYTDHFKRDVLIFHHGSAQEVGSLPGPISDVPFLRVGDAWWTTGGEIGPRIRGSETWLGMKYSGQIQQQR